MSQSPPFAPTAYSNRLTNTALFQRIIRQRQSYPMFCGVLRAFAPAACCVLPLLRRPAVFRQTDF